MNSNKCNWQLLSLKKSHVTQHIIFISACFKMSSCSTNASSRRWHHLPTARSIIAWLRAAHSLKVKIVNLYSASSLIQFVDLQLYNEDKVTDFQWVWGISNFLSWRMHYPVWIHYCQWSNYDFCISQSSVATTLERGGQK